MASPLRALALAAALPLAALAEEPAPATAAPGPWAWTVGLYSQYISRGVSYTSERPAVQGSLQYNFSSGAYAGLWVSNVSDRFLHDATLETDPYGGYAGNWGELAYDLGFWRWTFLGASLPVSRQKYDTVELYAGATWRWLNLKYWQEATDYFGVNSLTAAPDFGLAPNGSSRGSHYLEGNLSVDLGQGNVLGLHAARQVARHYGALDFNDYRISLDHDLGQGWTFSLAYSDTSADPRAYVDADGLNAARGKLLASIHAAF